MMSELKPAAYILCKHGMIAADDYQEYLEAVVVGESEDGDKEIEGYLKHGMATPLYEIPEGYKLVNAEYLHTAIVHSNRLINDPDIDVSVNFEFAIEQLEAAE